MKRQKSSAVSALETTDLRRVLKVDRNHPKVSVDRTESKDRNVVSHFIVLGGRVVQKNEVAD